MTAMVSVEEGVEGIETAGATTKRPKLLKAVKMLLLLMRTTAMLNSHF